MTGASRSALLAKGRALREAGSLEAALAAFRAALAADPRHAPTQVLIAVTLLDQGKAHEALASVTEALRLAPQSGAALRVRALALGAGGRLARAEQAAKEAITANPTHPAAHRVLGTILVRRRRYRQAEAALREALRLAPADVPALVALGTLLVWRGRLAEAAEIVNRCKAAAADDIGVLVLRGNLALLRGETTEAREFALWALSRNARHRPALTLLFAAHARRSPFLGLWWRIAARVGRWPRYTLAAVLPALMTLGAVPLFWLGVDPDRATAVAKLVALAAVGYLLAAQFVFRARIRRELRQVRLRRAF